MPKIRITIFFILLIFVCVKADTHQKKDVVEFRYSSNNALSVSIVGSFNNWDPSEFPLTKIDAVWVIYIELEPGYYYYRFVVDGREVFDPTNDWVIANGKGEKYSVILVGDPARPEREKNSRPLKIDLLPKPILESSPDFVELYYKVWEIAWDHLNHGTKLNKFKDNYIACGKTGQIEQWESSFAAAFSVYSNGVLPAMSALDNFYSKQGKDGSIEQSYSELDGKPVSYAGTIDPPLFAWLELRYYEITGDRSRLRKTLPKLIKYFDWIENSRHDDLGLGLYRSSPEESGMTNLPRTKWDTAVWIDLSAQQALSALSIYKIASVIKRKDITARFQSLYHQISNAVLFNCWDWDDNYFYDLNRSGNFRNIKHIGAYWTLLSGICPEEQFESFYRHLLNPDEFFRGHLFPSLSADNPNFDQDGNYWRGGVWGPTNYITIKGLNKYNRNNFAFVAASNHLKNMCAVYSQPNIDEDKISFNELYGDGYKTIWECYSPDIYEPGTGANNIFYSGQDALISAIGPIALLIEDVLGFQIIGAENKIIWRIQRNDRIGIQRLKFRDQFISIISTPLNGSRIVEVECSRPFDLEIRWRDRSSQHKLNSGFNSFMIE